LFEDVELKTLEDRGPNKSRCRKSGWDFDGKLMIQWDTKVGKVNVKNHVKPLMTTKVKAKEFWGLSKQ
jgi:hypothetical protein